METDESENGEPKHIPQRFSKNSKKRGSKVEQFKGIKSVTVQNEI